MFELITTYHYIITLCSLYNIKFFSVDENEQHVTNQIPVEKIHRFTIIANQFFLRGVV